MDPLYYGLVAGGFTTFGLIVRTEVVKLDEASGSDFQAAGS